MSGEVAITWLKLKHKSSKPVKKVVRMGGGGSGSSAKKRLRNCPSVEYDKKFKRGKSKFCQSGNRSM